MSQDNHVLPRLDDPNLSFHERTRLRCSLAKDLEDAGNYEAACRAMGELWRRVGERPELDQLDQRTAAEVLLRIGSLSGWVGSARQITGAQEAAKDLISESIAIFETLDERAKAAEAQTEMAWCYWREGAFNEARIVLQNAVTQLGDQAGDLKAVALLRSAIVEIGANQLSDALRILTDASPLFEVSGNHALKGNFHNTLANVLENLIASVCREDYTDRALIEYAAASFHFEQAGHTRHRARVENNLGFLLYKAAKFREAHEHLDRARRLFVNLKDSGCVAQVDETRARALLAQGQNSEAERAVRSAVQTLENGGEQALLAEALTTHGRALARLGRHAQARAALERAMEVAEQTGDSGGAGRAALTIIEELNDQLTPDETHAIYGCADQLLARSQHPETLDRLRLCARRVIAQTVQARPEEINAPGFVHVSEKTADVLRYAHSIAVTDGPLLITGETGTGKETLARLVHGWSGRAGQFVAVHCAALSDTPNESPLFEHKKGGLNGIIEDHLGVAREAAGGTLFLNEIGDLSISNQAELLRLIEYGEIYSADCSMLERLDVRIIAATNRDLRQEVEHGFFRADLFYRLDTFHIEIPPLRERAEDIPALAKHFIEDAHKRHNKQVSFTPASLEAMRQLPLKGNARELQNLIERTFLTATDGLEISARAIETVALRQTQKGGFVDAWAGCSLEEEVRRYEGRLIQLALDAAQGRITHTARLLGITHQSLSFILNGRHKGLLSARKPARRRRSSVIRPTLKKALEHEKKLARTDFLTGVANERYFYELVGAEIKRAGRYKHPFTVAYLDIDNFKNVNDRFGHGEGDSLLRLVADSVKSSIRSADVVARLGGDEFAVLLPETGFEPAQIVIGKVQKSLLEAVRRKGLSVTVSIGVVTCPSSSCTIDEIMKLADAQMYSVKHSVKGMIKHVVLGESGASAASSDE